MVAANELFDISRDKRRQALVRLSKAPDKSAIPFLLLSLYDPDEELAHTAYTTLHRFIPALGTQQDRSSFRKNKAAKTKVAFDWWLDFLKPKT